MTLFRDACAETEPVHVNKPLLLSKLRAKKKLIEQLRPVVLAPVRIILRRWPGGRLANLDEDDLVSEIFAALFADDEYHLKQYDASRGTLENYVSMFARSRLRDIQKKEIRRRALFPEPTPIDDSAEQVAHNDPQPDVLAEMSEEYEKIRECLERKLTTPRAKEMVGLLVDLRLSTDDIVEMGHDRQAVFRWRSTILAAIHECRGDLEREI